MDNAELIGLTVVLWISRSRQVRCGQVDCKGRWSAELSSSIKILVDLLTLDYGLGFIICIY